MKNIEEFEKFIESHWISNPNDESDTAKKQLSNIVDMSNELDIMIEDGDELDAWIQSKLAVAHSYIQAIYNYTKAEKKKDIENKLEDEFTDITGGEDE